MCARRHAIERIVITDELLDIFRKLDKLAVSGFSTA
jgi:hypothetical protein